MLREEHEGSLVTLICDSGDRYTATYFDERWLASNGLDVAPWRERIEKFLDTGEIRSMGLDEKQ